MWFSHCVLSSPMIVNSLVMLLSLLMSDRLVNTLESELNVYCISKNKILTVNKTLHLSINT